MIFLGHRIDADGIRSDVSRCSKIENYNNPKNIKQLQALLGFVNWFRPYIQGLSTQLLLITDKLKENVKFSWSKEDASTIESIFNIIKKGEYLKYPDFEKPFQLYCDASFNGIGGVLKQQENVIGFFSYKFSESNSTILS